MSAATPAAPVTVQPVIVTPDLDRLKAFYGGLVGAEEFTRVPEEGPAFFVGLRIDGSELGIVADESVPTGTPTRILLSIAVKDVDALLDRVAPLGGKVLGPANDMPWGQRVAHIQDPDGNAVNLTQPV
ncbi:VOC family protein [Streptomyces decoyicus]|uniref:VOC family protein n=1 Tax=Streptomyces decoyicus TaxID=249567 RepID=UPI0033C0DBD0